MTGTAAAQDQTDGRSGFGWLHRSACPFCGAPAAQARPAVRSDPPAETLSPEAHGRFLSGYGSGRVFFSYHRCASCGGLFCPVYYTEAQLQRLYGRQQENMAEVPLPARVATQRHYAELLAQAARPEGDYLELGADIGLFAEACAGRFALSRMHLIEPNLLVHDELRRRLSGRDLDLATGSIAELGLPPGGLGLAVMIHVADHVLEPAALFAQLHALLRPGGVLFLVVHNVDSTLARVLGRRFPPFTLQHPQLYGPSSLSALLQRSGFEVLRIARTKNHFPVMHLVRAGLQVAGLGALAPGFDLPWTPGLRLGNIAAIARRPAA
ncbi:MAG: class I SAM-dependent methyltransferase [Sneathiellaceae bacterium]